MKPLQIRHDDRSIAYKETPDERRSSGIFGGLKVKPGSLVLHLC